MPTMATRPWSFAGGALIVTVRLTPKGGRDAIEGIDHLADGTAVLKVRVRAAPSEGAANAALLRLMAVTLGVAPRQATLTGGATARIKRIRFAGDPSSLAQQLEKLVTNTRAQTVSPAG